MRVVWKRSGFLTPRFFCSASLSLIQSSRSSIESVPTESLIYGGPGSGIVYVFESTGDNTFQTHTFSTGSGAAGVFVADMDRDGLQEILCLKWSARRLKFFESLANDTWIEVANLPTRPTPGHIAGGRDADGNGKPDLFLGGAGSDY